MEFDEQSILEQIDIPQDIWAAMRTLNIKAFNRLRWDANDPTVVRDRSYLTFTSTVKRYVKHTMAVARNEELKEFLALYEASYWPPQVEGLREIYKRCGYHEITAMPKGELFRILFSWAAAEDLYDD